MVYEKKQSGDPDYDDKVPLKDQGLRVVRAGDGTEIARIDPALGPVDAQGAHVNLTDPKADELDTRPAPGDVAEEKATVQTYTPDDVPREEISVEEALTPDPDEMRARSAPAPQAEAAKPAAKPSRNTRDGQ